MFKEISKQSIYVGENFNTILEQFNQVDTSSIQVIADFDRTLTYAFNEEEFIPSLLAVIRNYGYLSNEYSIKAKELYNKFHPIEQSHELSNEEKIPYLIQWWEGQFDLLKNENLNLQDLDKIAKSQKIRIRKYTYETFKYLRSLKIPIIIFSASGIGVELIQRVLEYRDLLFDNVFIISNEFEWDEKGFMIKAKKPFVHSLNKNEGFIKNKPNIYEKVKDRKNVILIGDSLSDVHMVDGFKYDLLLKIGFLNFEYSKNIEKFVSYFDYVLLNDQSFKEIETIISNICSKNL